MGFVLFRFSNKKLWFLLISDDCYEHAVTHAKRRLNFCLCLCKLNMMGMLNMTCRAFLNFSLSKELLMNNNTLESLQLHVAQILTSKWLFLVLLKKNKGVLLIKKFPSRLVFPAK